MIADGPPPLAELRAAHAARAALAAEARAWDAERDRLQAAAEALRHEAAADRTAAAEAAAETASLQADPEAARRAELRQRIAAVVAGLRRTALPGTIPAGDDAEALAAAVKAHRQVAVEVVVGRLDGAERAVRLLRAGIFRGWWLALDGSRAGVARQRDGILMLEAADEAPIRAAFAQHDGRLPPAWTGMPE